MKRLQDSVVFIIGLGQIGGSLGFDFVAGRLVSVVVGYDLDESIREEAVRRGAIDRAVSSVEEGFSDADLVILAVPLRTIIELLPVLAAEARDNTSIFDVGGTKTEILEKAIELGLGERFIGGHPLAGNEGRGLAAATSGKFKEATFVLTPTDHTPPELVAQMEELVRGLDARPMILSAADHDLQIALTSHLPYLFSLSLLELFQTHALQSPALWNLTGGSFRSATRVASSSPDLIVDMFMTNPKNISHTVDAIVAKLTEIKQLIIRGDEKSLQELVNEIQTKTDELTSG